MVTANNPSDGNSGNEVTIPDVIPLSVAPAQRFYCDVDRAKHVLSKHFEVMRKKNRWQGPAGISISLLIALVTSSFKNTFGVEATVWQSVAIGFVILTAFFAVKYAINEFRTKTSVSKVIEDLRNGIED